MTSLSLMGLLVCILLLTVSCAPQFGGTISKDRSEYYSNSPNYKDGKFNNKNGEDVAVKITFLGFIKNIPLLFKPENPATVPEEDLPMENIELSNLNNLRNETRLFWFGHSSFLLQIEGKNILIDPVFSKRASPFSFLGPKRFSQSLSISIDNVPNIDAVIISHDHYDHLDYDTILQIKDKVKMFYTPLGVGVHLEKWSIEKERIIELDWWEERNHEELNFIAAPALHTSGRRPNSTGSTLWASWIIKSEKQTLYFSGDGGYDDHFKEIGERFGPFDFAMLECGQYNEMWPKLHMFPEQTVQAGIDIKARQIMPIHWGAFTISSHSWYEPVERVIAAANKLKLPIVVPKIGESIVIQDTISHSNSAWWVN